MTDKSKPKRELILSREQVRACDKNAVERFGVNSLILMENAGLAAAGLILSLLKDVHDPYVVIFAGGGNNGGDGFVVARQLYNAAVRVSVIICPDPAKYQGDALANLNIIRRMPIDIIYLHELAGDIQENVIQLHVRRAALIVDAMLGTGAASPPRGIIRKVIEILNQQAGPGKTIVALDVPTGLDTDTGLPLEIALRADHTVTFAAMKKGFTQPHAARYTGAVTVAAIGIDTALLLSGLNNQK